MNFVDAQPHGRENAREVPESKPSISATTEEETQKSQKQKHRA